MHNLHLSMLIRRIINNKLIFVAGSGFHSKFALILMLAGGNSAVLWREWEFFFFFGEMRYMCSVITHLFRFLEDNLYHIFRRYSAR